MGITLSMTGRIDSCVLVTMRVRAPGVRPLLPRPLELMTLESRGAEWAFVNVVLCHVRRMRPTWAPAAMGVSYHHVAYRLLVRARKRDGTEMRGLYFLRSDADSGIVCSMGNRLSDFRFHRASKITMTLDADAGMKWSCAVDGGAPARVRGKVLDPHEFTPDRDTVFRHEEQAKAFLKYTPVGVCPDASGRIMRVAEVDRNEDAWHERPMALDECRFEHFAALGIQDARVERAVSVAPIDYRWRLGRVVGLAVDDRE